MKRSWLRLVGGVACVALLAAACSGTEETDESSGKGRIKIGLLTELSGVGSPYGGPVRNAAELAVSEINAQGGVLGSQLELVIADDATDVNTSATQAERLVSQERVVALFNMSTSANREANIPVVQRSGTPYYYISFYEGGACLENMFLTGEVPEQYAPAYGYLQETLGGNTWYFLGNDYNWPRDTNAKAKETIEAAGGTVVGEEYVPFATTEYGEILNRIGSSGAKHILATVVGSDTEAFIKQWRAFGLDESTNILALALLENQLPSLGQDAVGIYSLYSYYGDLDNPENESFLSAYGDRYGAPGEQVTTLAEHMYATIWLWKLAVEEAGTTEAGAVVEATKGLTFSDAPQGAMTVDPVTHHVAQHMYLLKVGAEGKYELVNDFGLIDPGPQCSL